MLVARLPERGAHLSDGIRRGKEFPPCHWLRAAAGGRLLVLFACVLARFRRRLDMTGGSIEEFCLHPVALQLGECPAPQKNDQAVDGLGVTRQVKSFGRIARAPGLAIVAATELLRSIRQ